MTVPGPGTWTLAVWLTDAADNGSAMTAAETTLNVITDSTDGRGSSRGGSGDNNAGVGGSGGKGSHGGGFSSKAMIYLSETLRRRELLVHVMGPATGTVRVRFTGRLAGRTVASGVKVATLKHRKLTVRFWLGPRAAADAAIQVRATLDRDVTVTSTLHRRNN